MPSEGGVLGLPTSAQAPGRRLGWGREALSPQAVLPMQAGCLCRLAWGKHPRKMANPCGLRDDGG